MGNHIRDLQRAVSLHVFSVGGRPAMSKASIPRKYIEPAGFAVVAEHFMEFLQLRLEFLKVASYLSEPFQLRDLRLIQNFVQHLVVFMDFTCVS